MTIASAIQNAQEKVRNAYTAVSEKKGVLPTTQNLESLPGAIRSISGGDTVNTTAMSGAESFTGGEKVILNPAESTVAGTMTVTGGEIASATNSQQLLTGGAIVGDKIYGSFNASAGGRPDYKLYSGTIEGDTIVLTQSAEPSPYYASFVNLPVFSQNKVGIWSRMWDSTNQALVKIDKEGQITTLLSLDDQYKSFSSNEEGTVFARAKDRGGVDVYFIEEDLSIISKNWDYSFSVYDGSLFQLRDNFYITAPTNAGSRLLTCTKDSDLSAVSYTGTYLSNIKPLDKQGTLIGMESGSGQLKVQWFTGATFITMSEGQQGDVMPSVAGRGSFVVLPTGEGIESTADIFVIPNETPARIEHYKWAGRIQNKGTILSSADLGEYVYAGNDLHLDGNTGILWGTFYKTNATSGAQGKIFAVQTQGRTVITQFKAEPADKAFFDPSKSLTGFVDSNLGIDDIGNIELSVKTALDPNEEPWSDIGRVFGFDVKVTKGEY